VRRCCLLAVLSWVLAPPIALGAPAVAAPGPEARAGDGDFDARLRRIEERVEALQEKVFRTKARLATLQEMVVGGDLASGSKVVVVHRNEMGASYVLESATFALDGAPVFQEVDDGGALDRRPQLDVFAGRVAPGRHQLVVRLVYRGKGGGVPPSRDGARFDVESSYAFDAKAAEVTTVNVAGFEKGGLTTKLEDRPALRYDVAARAEAPPAAPAMPPSGGGVKR
jgi:hypothetical protein